MNSTRSFSSCSSLAPLAGALRMESDRPQGVSYTTAKNAAKEIDRLVASESALIQTNKHLRERLDFHKESLDKVSAELAALRKVHLQAASVLSLYKADPTALGLAMGQLEKDIGEAGSAAA